MQWSAQAGPCRALPIAFDAVQEAAFANRQGQHAQALHEEPQAAQGRMEKFLSRLSGPLEPMTPEEQDKACDAVIVAIGLVAVLIANVCYLGYVTPPGGPDPYWATCDYPLFTYFKMLNGSSFVLAVAAI